MLSAEDLFIKGRHSALLPPTSLRLEAGGLLLIQGDDQSTRTALALALSGRMRPTSGTVAWGRSDRLENLRRHAALVDSPEVNEPERHFRVRDLVAEDLALIPRRSRPHADAGAWLAAEGLAELGPLWIEELEPAARLDLLVRLALADFAVELLVFDSPDRHLADPDVWLPILTDSVASAERLVTAVAVVAQIPADWTGPAASAGASAGATAQEVSA
ncbi:ABC transporter ATP-binding protein [Arthrobacter sp. zg-Y750]|uniref:ABC transporter ATP-binding protein n=1 Tax=Arthrobacter sp. zg-Y750 TaxID=2894189 RepID=UPI001E61B15E|nr:ABC transporter ATP-binding protein [Arthrobacter sp. zg-Y750]MCC9178608.1 ABC transporter ATP-binding protein [Arthrobacter sp. zg-Y750]